VQTPVKKVVGLVYGMRILHLFIIGIGMQRHYKIEGEAPDDGEIYMRA
jgi:hypothetical protein